MDMMKEKKEHPWLTPAQLRRVSEDHARHHEGAGTPKVIVERTVLVGSAKPKRKHHPRQQPEWFETVGNQFF